MRCMDTDNILLYNIEWRTIKTSTINNEFELVEKEM